MAAAADVPMTIAGRGRVHTLPEQTCEHFDDLHPSRREWGVLFAHDSGERPWTPSRRSRDEPQHHATILANP